MTVEGLESRFVSKQQKQRRWTPAQQTAGVTAEALSPELRPLAPPTKTTTPAHPKTPIPPHWTAEPKPRCGGESGRSAR